MIVLEGYLCEEHFIPRTVKWVIYHDGIRRIPEANASRGSNEWKWEVWIQREPLENGLARRTP